MLNKMWKRIALLSMTAMLTVSNLMPERVWAQQSIESIEENVSSKKIKKVNDSIHTKVRCGLDGRVFYDTDTMVSVTVESDEDFVGTLQIVPERDYSDYQNMARAEDISLSAGSAKTFNFMLGMLPSNGKFTVSLLNEDGKVIYSEQDKASMYYAEDINIGVLSDDYVALGYWDNINLLTNAREGQTKLFELSEDVFPEKENVLSPLQYILIDNFDTAKLSENQYTALKKWVKAGGTLLLALGPNYQNVLHSFQDDFVSGTLGSMQTQEVSVYNMTYRDLPDIEELELLEEASEVTEEFVDEIMEAASEEVLMNSDELGTVNLEVMDFQLTDGEQISVFQTNHLAYGKQYGRGGVVVVGFDLAMEPVISMTGREDMAANLLFQADDFLDQETEYYSENNYEAMHVAGLLDQTKHPSGILFGLILLVYIILVGPLLYLFLKKKQKRELVWVLVPVFSLGCVFVVFLASIPYRVNKPIINVFTVLDKEGTAIQEKDFVSIICPKAKQYSMLLESGYEDLTVDPYSYSDVDIFGTGEKKSDYDYLLHKTNEGTKLELQISNAFETKQMFSNKMYEGTISDIQLDLSCRTDGFDGTVTNETGYNLENVVVFFERHFYVIDELAQGESVTLKEEDMKYLSFYGSFSTFNQDKTGKTDYLRESVNDYMVTQYVSNGAYYSTTNYNHGVVWGRIKDISVQVIEEKNTNNFNYTVFKTAFQAEYEDVTGIYVGDILECRTEQSDKDYDEYDKMIYDRDLSLTYLFPTTNMILEYQKEDAENSYHLYPDVYLVHPVTGEERQIFVDEDRVALSDFADYIAEDGTIEMMYHCPSYETYSYYLPTISAKEVQ